MSSDRKGKNIMKDQRYALRLTFLSGKTGEWMTTILPQRLAKREWAERAAEDLNARGAKAEVITVSA